LFGSLALLRRHTHCRRLKIPLREGKPWISTRIAAQGKKGDVKSTVLKLAQTLARPGPRLAGAEI